MKTLLLSEYILSLSSSHANSIHQKVALFMPLPEKITISISRTKKYFAGLSSLFKNIGVLAPVKLNWFDFDFNFDNILDKDWTFLTFPH